MTSSYLLQLPAEIRLKILEELLFSSGPLVPRPVPCRECALAVPRVAVYTHLFKHERQKKTLGLYTAVLRTCRQLNKEGTPILHANTAAVEVWFAENLTGYPYQRIHIGFADYVFDNQEELSHGMQIPLSKLHLTIRPRWYDGNIESFDKSFYDSIATLLESTKQFRQLHVQFDLPLDISDAHSESRSATYGQIGGWLRRIDRIPHVCVTRDVPQALTVLLALSTMKRDNELEEAVADLEGLQVLHDDQT